MTRLAKVLLMVALMAGCATTPLVLKPVADPHKTPIAVLGVFECGKMKGIVVVTKAGDVVPVPDDNPADLAALAKLLPPESAELIDLIDLTDNCLPTQTT